MSRLRNKAIVSTLTGKCFLHDETGWGKCWWAFIDTAGQPYEFHVLEDGDYITIYSRDDPTQILWEGTIRLSEPSVLTDTIWYLNSDQSGVSPLIWLQWFVNGNPAKLKAIVREDNSKWL